MQLVHDEKLLMTGINIQNDIQYFAKSIINDIKSLNRLDEGFRYTCVCISGSTEWLFGYTKDNIFNQVVNKIKENMKSYYKNTFDIDLDDGYCDNYIEGSACSCPFDL